MDARGNARIVRVLKGSSRVASGVVAGAGCIALTSRAFGTGSLTSLLPGFLSITPNTAMTFIISGIAVWCSGGATGSSIPRRIVQGCAILLLLLGAATIFEYVSSVDLRFDQILFPESYTASSPAFPGRMSPVASVDAVLIGLALLLTRKTIFRTSPTNVLALAVATVSFLALMGYAYGLSVPPHFEFIQPPALHTMPAFLLIGIGMLFSQPERGMMLTFSSSAVGGTMLRRIVPFAIIAPAVIGWLRVEGQSMGLYDTSFGIALFVLANILILLTVLWWNGRSINASDLRRMEAADALHASELRYREMFDRSPVPMWVFDDATGSMLAVNESALRQYGYTRDGFLSVRNSDLIVDGERGFLPSGLPPYTSRHRRRDGTTFTAEIAAQPIVFDGRKAFIAMARDISDRNAVEELRNWLASIVQFSDDAIIGKALDGTITSWNRAAEALFGYRAEEAIGKSIRILIPSDRQEEEDAILARLTAGEHVDQFESVRMHRDGTPIDVSISVSPVLDTTGTIIGASKIVRDIRKQKLAEKALHSAEERYRGTLDGMMEGCQIIGFDWRYLYLNDAAAMHGRRQKEDLIGKTMMAAYPGIEQTPVFSHLRECMVTRKPSRTQNEFVFPDNSRGWFELIIQPVAEGIFILSKDITREKEMEIELRNHRDRLEELVTQRTTQLEAANRELEAFSYSVSHDLRAPLRSIDGFSQALLEDYEGQLDVQGKDFLRRVRAASQHMARLIDDMLTLARVTRAELRAETVNLSTMAQSVADELRKGAPDRQVEFYIASEIFVRGDPQLLRVVMDNLLSNAWKYTSRHPQAKIEFGLLNGGRPKTYFVRDDGAGFEKAYVHKLFGAFQRLHSSKEFPGTGIGLATAQRIVHRHGGRIWAEGDVEKGATFYFTLA